MRRRNIPSKLIMTGLFAFFAAFLIYPIWLTVQGGFESRTGGFTMHHIWIVFEDPVLRNGFLNALGIAVCTTLVCLIIALPLATLAARYTFPFKGVFSAMVLVPLILPPFVGAIGLHHLLGTYGALNTFLVDAGWL